MEYVSRGIESIKYVLTWAFLLFVKRTTLKGQKEITLPHENVKVYTFDKDSPGFAQATPFGTILWNLHRAEDVSVPAKQLLVTHEQSHKNRNVVWKAIIYTPLIILLALTYRGGQLLIDTGLSEMSTAVMTNVVANWILALVLFLIAVRVEEVIADYQTLQKLGEEHFLEAYRELLGQGDSTFTGKIMRKILYNHPKQTVKLYNLLNS
jgi:hypothetical protein